jgi:hypothetical protein
MTALGVQTKEGSVKRFLQAALILALLGCATPHAPSSAAAQQPACAAPELRQLDFWLGDWDVRWDASPGQPAGQGKNVITRDFEGCVVHERFDGGPSTGNLIGESWSVYSASALRWRQTWVDNQGGYFALAGGPQDGKFILVSSDLADNTPRQRMVFEDITANAFTWRWQRTTDRGATWTDSWVIYYSRRTPP